MDYSGMIFWHLWMENEKITFKAFVLNRNQKITQCNSWLWSPYVPWIIFVVTISYNFISVMESEISTQMIASISSGLIFSTIYKRICEKIFFPLLILFYATLQSTFHIASLRRYDTSQWSPWSSWVSAWILVLCCNVVVNVGWLTG